MVGLLPSTSDGELQPVGEHPAAAGLGAARFAGAAHPARLRPRSPQPGPEVSPRLSPVPSRPAGRMRPERPTRGSSVSSWPGGRRSPRPLAAGCTGRPRRIPHGPGEAGRGSCHGAAGGAGSASPVTSGGQKTRCANRGLHVRTPSESTLSAALSMGGFQVGSGISEALNHILEGQISLNSCRSGTGPFLITATWPAASSARLAPAMRLCSPYCRGSPSNSGVSRTGLDSDSGGFPNNRG